MHTRADLLAEYETLTDVVMADHRELAEFLVAEKQTKVNGYAQAADARTNSDRQNAGDLAALDLTVDIFRLKGKIAAHEARVAFITTALSYSS